MTNTDKQNEVNLFFQIASELRRAERENADPVEMLELLDEVEAYHKNTSSAFIRERCADLLRRHESLNTAAAR
ncbi:MAG: hypothetical protein EOS81_29675 [Mesorhizobium sp.]|uniref:hypothetical protein n=1 Tax=unclassified Mesorhizobium TaxID=325217 RepID=UPI000F752D0C|nr:MULTISPECIES: hypothetical protein [unclassified Mesorhizobium]RVC73344.1 hypothetical protein EN766_21120 [Mesorhizobium sp. M2A.F.Ca.ET.046.02.1.1]AZO36320.1 hypothetical protein EJ072_19255 [Mesorhizobium sp. M2A.F.Ca.ET.046.03.2.1]RWB39880.1 MAG: hypothetical protein EOQ44_26825 [Mesorhizobium sp.]RWE14892.1 MAG: hypothetical protein EOS76_24115 [Mesorhizobium sp.]RWE86595.1 MAG: hypothetical protein EOS81_29675 [Mesorhizobium sp.]